MKLDKVYLCVECEEVFDQPDCLDEKSYEEIKEVCPNF